MPDLTYIPPAGLPASLSRGVAVQVVDREGVVLGDQTVTKITARVVTTSCGRDWDRKTGGWRNQAGQVFPFPSIRVPAAR